MIIAEKLESVKPSASMVTAMSAQALKLSGVDVIDLSLGEPDFSTPRHIIEAAYRAGLNGETRYTSTSGTNSLKEAIIEKFRTENNLTFGEQNIIVSNGAQHVISNALMATLNPDDEVILISPYFGSYYDIIRVLGGSPKVVQCSAENAYRLTPELLEAAITSRTKWLILNSPSNPAGVVYSRAQLHALRDVLTANPHVNILSDEVYEHIVFDGAEFCSFADACPELQDRTLVVNGVSKAYAMTGWRIGYGAGPVELIRAMTLTQGQMTSSPCSISQAAALSALTGPQEHIDKFRRAFHQRRDYVVEAIRNTDGLNAVMPQGAFYVFVNCSDWIGRNAENMGTLNTDGEISHAILTRKNVAVVPGTAYGAPSHFRISTAKSLQALQSAMALIQEFANE